MPSTYRSGTPIRQTRVNKIVAGKTTEPEIRKWFGIPATIVSPTAQTTPSLLGIMTGVETMPGSPRTYYELFSKHNLTENHVVYVYQATTTKQTFWPLGISDSNSYSDTLLVLIDKKTGTVQDHIFSKIR